MAGKLVKIPYHNIGFGGEGFYFDVAFDRVRINLSNRYATIYSIEPIPDEEARARIIERMERFGIEKVQNYIDNGYLVLIDNESIYFDAGLNPQSLKSVWLSLFADMNRKQRGGSRKGTQRGVSAIYSAESYINRDHIDSFIAWEIMTGKEFRKPTELFCWYKKQWLQELSFVHLVHLFSAHYASVHEGWRYKRWNNGEIADLIIQGIEKALGNKSALAVIETMRMRYGLSKSDITSKPEYFETIIKIMLQDNDADQVLDSIKTVLKESIIFDSDDFMKISQKRNNGDTGSL